MPFPAHRELDELIRQLHRANEQLHDARLEWERTLDAPAFRHQQRVDDARERLIQAEHEVEAVEDRIERALHP